MPFKVVKARREHLTKLGREGVLRAYMEYGSIREMMQHLFEPNTEDGKGRVGTTAFYEWLHEDPEREEWWEKAKQMRGEQDLDDVAYHAEEIDQENWQAKRAQIDAKKWLAGQRNKKYSDKSAAEETLGQALMKALNIIEDKERKAVTEPMEAEIVEED